MFEVTKVALSLPDIQTLISDGEWRSLDGGFDVCGLRHCMLVLTTVGGRKNMQNCTESCLR